MHLAYVEADEGDAQRLRETFPRLSVTILPRPLTEENVEGLRDADLLSVFVKSQVTAGVLAALPNLKMIATRSTGVDHIDLAACRKRGIVVSNVPTYGENTVAEHAFALILALSRKIFQSYERTEHMDFDRAGLQGFDLMGKTLGVVGTGNIGKHTIRIGRGFSMRVVAYDVRPDARLAAELGFSYTETLDDLLARSDVITLHVPFFPATKHLINMDNVKNVKRGAILVNTARGGIVDTRAILWALEEGVLSGAGLDVLEEENDTYEPIELLTTARAKNTELAAVLRNHVLIARDDVIITPHNAFNSVEAVRRIFDTTEKNIRAFLGGAPINVVVQKP